MAFETQRQRTARLEAENAALRAKVSADETPIGAPVKVALPAPTPTARVTYGPVSPLPPGWAYEPPTTKEYHGCHRATGSLAGASITVKPATFGIGKTVAYGRFQAWLLETGMKPEISATIAKVRAALGPCPDPSCDKG